MVISLLHLVFAAKAQGKAEPDSLKTLENTAYANYLQPMTFSVASIIYAEPDINSRRIDILLFKTNLRLLERVEKSLQIDNEVIGTNGEKYIATTYEVLIWYRIAWMKGSAYIKSSDVATHSFADTRGQCDYFFVTANQSCIFKYDKIKKSIVDSLKLESVRFDIVQVVNSSGLKNVEKLFRITMINAYCGGGITDVFITDANNSLSELISTGSFADDGSADANASTVWLPVKSGKEKVTLFANGNSKTTFDETFTSYKEPLPKSLTIPMMELIVLKEIEVKTLYDKNDEPILMKNGDYKSKTLQKTSYFRWNGAKLVRLSIK